MKWIKTLVGVSIGILFLVLMSYLYDIISSYQPHYAPEQLAPWNVCGIIHPNLTTIQQEQQAQSTQSLNGLSVSLIGRVVDVRDNPMDARLHSILPPCTIENNNIPLSIISNYRRFDLQPISIPECPGHTAADIKNIIDKFFVR